MTTLLAILVGAYAAYAGSAWILGHVTGSCAIASKISAPNGPLRAEITTCGNRADALETEIWLIDGKMGERIFHATTPMSREIFDQGAEARQFAVAHDIQVSWRDASHMDVSVNDNAHWQQDYDSDRGVTFSLKRRAKDDVR